MDNHDPMYDVKDEQAEIEVEIEGKQVLLKFTHIPDQVYNEKREVPAVALDGELGVSILSEKTMFANVKTREGSVSMVLSRLKAEILLLKKHDGFLCVDISGWHAFPKQSGRFYIRAGERQIQWSLLSA